jgi:Raf kinase inhibitor-like YbhB/YbcL family protein
MKKYILLLTVLVLSACATATAEPVPTAVPATATVEPTSTPIPVTATAQVENLEITSPAFKNGEAIPTIYSCRGEDISPALTWAEPPAGTQSFVIIMDDPGAGWTHWTIYNIPASVRDLKEALPVDPELSDGSLQGKTSFGSSGYGGPCPPTGVHEYFFRLYALDTMLSVPTKSFGFEIVSAMKGHILASGELTGTFP